MPFTSARLTPLLIATVLALGPGSRVVVAEDEDHCGPGELCVTVTGLPEVDQDLRLMLYEAEEENWPGRFRSLPTPGWVVTEYPRLPDSLELRVRLPMEENLASIANTPLEGARLGLAVATGVDSIMTVDPKDARGFSAETLAYEAGAAMDFGAIDLALPAGDTCELNAFHPSCLSGGRFWQPHFLGQEDFVPGAIYLDLFDIDGDGTKDIVTVGEPHFEDAERPLESLRLGIYYLNPDLTLRESEIVDQWSEEDQLFYSPWGVRVVEHSDEPWLIVGTNIPGLAPLVDGTGAVLSYHKVDGEWLREELVSNPDPTDVNHNAMIVVPCDIDLDGDQDLALSTAYNSSGVGNWSENTGLADPAWIHHLQDPDPDTDPSIEGTLAYKCTDLTGDGYPEVAYNAMFTIPDTSPPRYHGEIWLGVNPGTSDEPWELVVLDDDNWASADMWFHDFDGDGYEDLIANQIFSSTVTRYWNPGGDMSQAWEPEIIISGLTSPSDMWLTDMDDDGHIDVVSADHTAHRGVWHRNPGDDPDGVWEPHAIYRDIRMPGDFAMDDLDGDGDLDWAGISMTEGRAFVVEQVEPPSGLVATISLPDGFDEEVRMLLVSMARELPATGMPVAMPAMIENTDRDGDGELDVDQVLAPGKDLTLAIDDVGLEGEYHVVAVAYVEGGGAFQPKPGVDYLAASEALTFGQGPVEAHLELEPYSE
jgi:hypothetical protein